MRKLTIIVLSSLLAVLLVLGCGGTGHGSPTAICNDGTMSFDCVDMCFYQGGVREDLGVCILP